MSKYLELRANPPKLTIKEGAREVIFKTVASMCDNIHYITFKKNEEGDFKMSGCSLYGGVDFSLLQRVIEGDFIFRYNKKLENLYIGEMVVKGDCVINNLYDTKNIEISLDSVGGNLKLTQIQTQNIIFKNTGSMEIGGDLDLSYSTIKSIDYNFPKNIDGSIILQYTDLKSVKGLPKIINKNLDLRGLELKDLNGFPKEIKGDLVISKDFGFTQEEVRSICKIQGEILIMK
jgi:hypothetical protein